MAAALAAAVVVAGCGGDSGRRAQPEEPVEPTWPELPSRPGTRSTQDPTTRPATRQTTRPATRSTTGPATGPATRPATGPSTAPTTSPTTEPATQPTTGPTTQAAPTEREPTLVFVETPTPDGQALAQLFAEFAAGTLHTESPSAAMIDQAATLQTAAVRLAPEDARLARELVEMRLATGDREGALEALEHYRRLRPDDVLAQIRYIDLSADRMEVADDRLSYLTRVAASDRVPEEVRSHAATMASLLLREAMDDSGADVMLEQAVALNPYSPQALQLFYERQLATGATPAQRVDALAMLARSNLFQPTVLARIAEELALAGLVEDAHQMYQRVGQVYRSLGMAPPAELMRDVAAIQLVTGRPQAAQQVLLALEQQPLTAWDGTEVPGLAPAQGDAVLLEPMVADAGGANQVARIAAADRSGNLIRARGLMPISRELAGQPQPPAAAPADQQQGIPPVPETALPDVVAEARQLSADDLPPQRRALAARYAVSLADLAWLDLYYRAQPTDPAILEALALLVPADSATLARLEGWQLWRQNQPEEARARLEMVSSQDALSHLALLLMTDGEEGMEDRAQALLTSSPTGLVRAFLADALRPYGARVEPHEDAPEVREAMQTLPPELFGLLDPAEVSDFYSLVGVPQVVRHEYGEPMLVEVSIRNSGRHPITIGPEGLIHPTLRLDARVRGQLPQEQPVPAANVVEIWGGVRLDPGEKITQVVRLDGPRLSALMRQAPQLSLTIFGDVSTNPATVQTEQGVALATAPGGQSQRLSRVLTRSGFALDLNNPNFAGVMEQRLELLRTGEPLVRMRTAQWAQGQLDWLVQYITRRQQENAPDSELAPLRSVAGQLQNALRRAGSNVGLSGRDAAANAWLKYSTAASVAPEDRVRVARQLLAAEAFEARIVGMLAASTLIPDADLVEQLVAPLAENDPDATARAFARNVLVYNRQRPATQPATQPGPGAVPSPVPAGP